MKVTHSILFLFALLPQALADVEFVFPSPSAILRTGDVLTAQWRESGRLPHISELIHYDLYLCVGGELAGTHEVAVLLSKDTVFARGNSISFKLDPSISGNTTDTYFLKMISWGPDASVINFSKDFTITNMAGPNSTSVSQGPSPTIDDFAISDGDLIEPVELRKRQVDGEAFTVPYQLQTGPTRYAPMAKKPASTIPARSPTPQFPASAYTIATTYLPPATVEITIAASVTYSVVSIENTASPAPHLHDAQMKRYLERWKD
ncbi:putative beta-1,6-glucan biosynthesis protein (Knh1) [Aspergillus homomorphus CBS 101889]|uniref:Putative beta-1,6-glucan boisynthesis protein n=1 Tax=Aspergillus homomorphus (strain CBS 101889) TaxID=1450537 RepID=A0A395I4A1_ASPHC|nr:putative beta-1,6-glucan boisynthesis protein [Aspergillus homomorphus CBS 101889]RAL15031.1 putative beta-1,6-glucan boisynthesis protein [Aspergillus homomorphus CBS 101889]